MQSPLFIAGCAVLLGVLSWPAWTPPPLAALGACAACVALALARGERPGGWLCAWLGALCLGAAAPGLQVPGPALAGPVAVRGLVVERGALSARLALEEVNGRPAHGPLQLRGEALVTAEAEVGDEVLVFGSARGAVGSTLPGEQDPAWEAALGGVWSVLSVERLARLGPPRPAAPDPFATARHRGLLRSLALGDRSGLDEPTRALLRETGTSHLIAISGLHLGMLGGLAAGLCTLLLRPLALLRPGGVLPWLPPLVGALVAAGFGDLVGWPVSARRAALMLGGVMLGRALGRPGAAWGWLGLSAALIALHEPGAARSLSFGLSFGAVAGMLALTPALERLLPPDLPWGVRWLLGGLIATLGATAGTLPLGAWVFQALPLTSPLSNLLAIPLVSAITLPAALLSLGGHPAPLWLADTSVDALLAWLRLTHGPLLHPAVGPLGAAALGAAALCGRRVGLGLAGLVLGLGLRSRPVGVLQLTFLSVGQGDATLVQWPDGRAWLVDGGPPSDQVLRYLRREGLTRLEELWLSHPHPDHSGGLLPVLEGLEVGRLRLARLPREGEEELTALVELALRAGVEVVAGVGGRATARPGVTLLGPPPALLAARRKNLNDESLVLRLAHGAHTALLTGDIERRGEEALARAWTQAAPLTVLKVAHHGSDTSSAPALLAALRPELAVVSCGPQNRFGHPDPEVLTRLEGTRVLRTDTDGTVQLRSDGHTLRVRTWAPGQGWSPWAPHPPPPAQPLSAAQPAGPGPPAPGTGPPSPPPPG